MRFSAVCLLFCFVARIASADASANIEARTQYYPDVGLPWSMDNEDQLFQRHPDTGYFTPVTPGFGLPDFFYVRWDFRTRGWVWCSGTDKRAFAAGTKVQGRHLFLPGSRGLNWFRLMEAVPPHQADATRWTQVTDRNRPCVYRRNLFDGAVQRIECAREGWEQELGGELDPLTPPAPSCRITVATPEVILGQAASYDWEIIGEFTAGIIDGIIRRPDSRRGTDIVFTRTLGVQRIVGTISGPGGMGYCNGQYLVKPAQPPPPPPPTLGCTLTVNSPVRLTDQAVISMTIRGPVLQAAIDGTPISLVHLRRVITPRAVGLQTVNGTVSGAAGTPPGACQASFQVVP